MRSPFSSRLPSLEENAISRALDERRRRGAPLFDLTESNPTVVGLRYPEAEILAALADPRALTYRPTPRGLDEARAAVAGYYARHAMAVDPARLWLTASTSEAYAWLFKLLCDPGQRVLVPRPSYPLFEHLSSLEGVRAASYPLRYHGGWYLDVDELAAQVDGDTRAILVVHPNNPTGHFVKRPELERLVELCRARSLALISDEVFLDYAFGDDGGRAGSLAAVDDVLSFALSGLSKPAGLPQLKLGWIHLNGPAREVAAAAERLDLIADTYLSVGSPVQHAAARLLPLVDDLGAQLRQRVRDNRAHLKTVLRDSAAQLLDGEGGWSAVLRLPRTRGEVEWVLAFLDEGVVVHPGFFFDFEEEAYVVVSLLPGPAEFEIAIARLLACVAAA